ncbi:MAG: tetratricopeptide repeat protein [Planctomycetes bacterium]|nr:tetratricopeptide repeat protein [Planctomycetota bacterium]
MSHEKLEAAVNDYYAGHAKAAEVVLRQLSPNPDQIEMPGKLAPLDEALWYEVMGNLSLDKGEFPASIQYFERMIEREQAGGGDKNGLANSYCRLGEAQAAGKQLQNAVISFQKAVDLKEQVQAPPASRVNVFFRFGEALLLGEKHEEAAEWFRKAIAAAEVAKSDDETVAHLWFHLGRALKPLAAQLDTSLKFQEAVAGVQQAHTGKAQAVPTELKKKLAAWNTEGEKAFNNAIKAAEKAGMALTKRIQIQRGLAEMLYIAGKPMPSVMARRKAIKMAEDAHEDPLAVAHLQHGLGESLSQLNQHEEAIKMFQSAVKGKEKSKADAHILAKSWFGLGEACAVAGRKKEAEDAFRKAVDCEEKSDVKDDGKADRLTKYHHALGTFLDSIGKKDEAKKFLERAEG